MLGRVLKRKLLCAGFEEEIERIRRGEFGDEIDFDDEFIGRFGKEQAREMVAQRILLPIEKVLGSE